MCNYTLPKKARFFNLAALLRDNVKSLVPYSSARSEFTGQATVFLDANENALAAAESPYARYPDPLQLKLKEQIGRIKGVPLGNIFVGNGSDEIIDLLIRAVCEPGRDSIMVLPPTYGMYEVSAQINNVAVQAVPLGFDFCVDSSALLAALTPQTKLIFVCSPNNPTGTLAERSAVLPLLEGFNGLVVIDEAYIDFCPEKSFLPLIAAYPNLYILQTLSKAWGRAGLRLGLGFGSPELSAVLNRLKPPYNISQPAQSEGLKALQQADRKAAMVSELLEQRAALRVGLQLLSCVVDVYPSEANFLLVRFYNAEAIYRHLLEQGIVVRSRTKLPGCENCLRITVGTAAENAALLDALRLWED